MRLSTKIPLLIFVGCVAAGAVGSVLLAARQGAEIRESFERREEGLVRSMGAMGASLMAANPPDDRALQQAVDNLEEFGQGAAPGSEWLAFVDCAGRVVAHSDPRRFGTVLREAPAGWLRCAAAEDGVEPPADERVAGLAYQGERLLIAVPVRLETRSGTVVAAFSLDEVERHEAAGRRQIFFWSAGLAVVLGVALSLLLRMAVARRLSRLTADTVALREGHLERRSKEAGGDEVGQLARSFNAMAERIAEHQHNLEGQVQARTHELEKANRELERLATTDALTGLLNRRRMEEILDSTIDHHRRKGRTLSVVMIDLDHFKRFNDTHGHLAGDELLRELGDRLRLRKRLTDSAARLGADPEAACRPAGAALGDDDAAARYGGEEFLLILPETTKSDAVRVAERVRSAVESDVRVRELGDAGRVTLSAGVASFPEDGSEHDALLQAADTALYAAKHAGRNRVMAAPAAPPPDRRSTIPPFTPAAPGGKS